jgi:hypothetical protein
VVDDELLRLGLVRHAAVVVQRADDVHLDPVSSISFIRDFRTCAS